MPVISRRPAIAAVGCLYLLVSLVIILLVFVGSNGTQTNGNVEGNMKALTQCTILPNTMARDEVNGHCRYSVDAYYFPNGGSEKLNVVCWSGILETIWGDCNAAKTFGDRFSFSTRQTTVECWYDPQHPTLVRLWSVLEADKAIPSSTTEDTQAVTAVIVLISIVVVFIIIGVALKCGLFGNYFLWARPAHRPLPQEPGCTASAAPMSPVTHPLSTPFLYSNTGNTPPVQQPVPYHAASPQTPMVKVGLAQVPASMVHDLDV
eukprot:TRINITY_DN15862_c1_g1_i2.p1 TRINITY_DN15862_c1_g1~~TRINITY_DN15862_c1_g1_i2.p1  ORF type:complete len:262 (+),score=34.17 TRINITY_DN15862_c1_g1_i2:52-837(+)